MSTYQHERDEHALPGYDLTCEFATLDPPPPDTQRLFDAVSANQESMDEFVSMMTGTLPVPEFFDPENLDRIFATAN